MITKSFYSPRARARRARQEFFREVMGPADSTPVLDPGAGSGLLAFALDSQKRQMMIGDIKTGNLRTARESFSCVPLACLFVAPRLLATRGASIPLGWPSKAWVAGVGACDITLRNMRLTVRRTGPSLPKHWIPHRLGTMVSR
jgi:hypothetical protein